MFDLPLVSQAPESGESDTSVPFHGVPTVGSLFSWSTYPQRRQIYHHILLHAYQHLQSSMSPDHVSRLLHLAKFSVKACARDFDFVQSPQPSILLPDLHFAPLTYMSLLSCVELPDVPFPFSHFASVWTTITLVDPSASHCSSGTSRSVWTWATEFG